MCPDLNALLARIYKQYDMPVIVTDISYHLIAYGGPLPCPDHYWDVIISSGTAQPDTIIDGYFRDGYMERLSAEKGPFLVDWGISKDSPQTTCGVTVNNNLEGIASVLYIDDDKAEIAIELNAALKNAAGIYLAARNEIGMNASVPERAFAARILLEDTDVPIQLLEDTTFYKKAHVVPKYIVIAIQLRNSSPGRLQNLRSGIKSHIPSMLYVNKNNRVFCFFSGIDGAQKINNVLDAIDSEAQGKVDYVCGISQSFYNLNTRAAYVEQAKLALDCGLNSTSGKQKYFFTELYSTIILKFGHLNIRPENLILPEIRILIQMDKENGTNFYDSLKCYLYNRCDVSKTAAQLFLHRNSLQYRIKRVQEIIGVDLANQDDFERFYVCCRINDLLIQEDEINSARG